MTFALLSFGASGSASTWPLSSLLMSSCLSCSKSRTSETVLVTYTKKVSRPDGEALDHLTFTKPFVFSEYNSEIVKRSSSPKPRWFLQAKRKW